MDHRNSRTAELFAAGRGVAPHLRTIGSAMAAPERAIPLPRQINQERVKFKGMVRVAVAGVVAGEGAGVIVVG